MKEFWQVIKRYVPPYKGYLGGSIALNILSGVFNVFSFSLLIPILQILFNVGEATYEFIPWHQGMAFNEITNNVYWFVSQYVTEWGPARVLLALCLVFAVVIFFWMAFHQNGQSLTWFARDYTQSFAEGWPRLGEPSRPVLV